MFRGAALDVGNAGPSVNLRCVQNIFSQGNFGWGFPAKVKP